MKKDILQKRVCRSRIRRLRLSLCFFAVFSWTGAATAVSLHEIETLLNNAEYRKALDAISVELKQHYTSVELRTRLLWMKALCHVSDDQIALAKSSLMNLLATNPLFEPDPNSSPKILGLFKSIFAKFKEQGGLEQSVKASFVPIDNLVPGEPFTFQIKIDDATILQKGARLELHLRRLGNSEYSSLDFKILNASGLFEATVPPILTKHVEQEVTFEYYVEVIAENGARLGSVGQATLPLTFLAKPSLKEIAADGAGEQKKGFFTTAIFICAATITIGGVIAAMVIFARPPQGQVGLTVTLSE